MREKLINVYLEKFGTTPVIIRSPGRINIIGEHTDYNEGFVLPAAIDKAVYMAIDKRLDDEVHLLAMDFDETFIGNITSIQKTNSIWANYILGVINELQKAGKKLGGFNAVITSDLPIGAGISSSAALECATAFALNHLFDLQLDKIDLVKHAQKAEHNYAGVMCGIMDQFASMMGKRVHCIKLDCKTLAYEYVPLHLEGYVILLLNTNVKHALASTAYNTRRNECAAGVALIQANHPEVQSLRDVTIDMLNQYVLSANPLVYKRCRFVVEEIARLQDACADLQSGQLKALGQKMFATHEGLRNAYDVSCKELDYLVDAVKNNEDVLGARMMGGGFGGCTINIVKEEAVELLVAQLTIAYEKDMHLPLSPIIAKIDEGTSIC